MRRTLTFMEEAEIRVALDNAHRTLARMSMNPSVAAALGAVTRAAAILGDPTYLAREKGAR